MLKLSCLCGHVTIEIAKKPGLINECNCAFCSKSGAQWGYFHPSDVDVAGPTQGFSRTDKTDPNAQIYFCRTCGATTHFVLTESAMTRFGKSLVGVNMRLADESDLAGIELRYPDGRAWSGEGSIGYVRDARIMGVV